MRILFVNQYLPPDTSGTAVMLGSLVEDLGRVHQVSVIAGRPSYGAEAGGVRPRGVTVLQVPSTSFGRRTLVGRACNYLSFALLAAARACFGPRPEVVVTMTDPPFVGLIGVLAGRRHRAPFVVICHDVYPDIAVALGRLRNQGLIRMWRAVNGLVYRGAARIVIVSRDMEERLISQGVDPAKLAYVPTWAERQAPAPETVRKLRAQHGWNGRFVVMHAGNVGLAQNVGILADLAERLVEEPDVEIVVLGDGVAKPLLERAVRERGLANLVLLPALGKEGAQALMAAADVHVISLVPGLWGCAMPSKTYGIMAAGRPFVAAVDRGSEPARLAEEVGCGRWVPAGDADALAAAVLKLRAAPLDALGDRGRCAFEQRFVRERVTAEIGGLLEAFAPRR